MSLKETHDNCLPVVSKFKDIKFDKETESCPLPRDEHLVFNKQKTMTHFIETIENILIYGDPQIWKKLDLQVDQIPPIMRDTPLFIGNHLISFFGREIRIFQQNLEFIEQNLCDFSPRQFQACKKAVQKTRDYLNEFCDLIKTNPKNSNIRIIWVLPSN